MIAFSGFYKSFADPIEMTYFESAPNNFTPKNLGSATVYGTEIEIRKKLFFHLTKIRIDSYKCKCFNH